MGERLIPIIPVARAIILNDEGNVLLGIRAGGYGAGQWALVGGKVDLNESLEQAVVREIEEEIGVRFICSNFFKTQLDITSIPGKAGETHYFVGKVEGKFKLDPREVADLKFFSKDEIENLDIAFDHKEIITSFFQSKFLL